MTLPSPIPPAPSTGSALPRGVARLRLTEPVLLYLLPIAALLLLGALIDALLLGEWVGAAMLGTGALLVAGAAWAARVSVFSPCGAMTERVNAALNARLNR